MDPHANIREQRELAREVQEATESIRAGEIRTAEHPLVEAADRLAELVLAVDEWRRKGGFDPYQTPERKTDDPWPIITDLIDSYKLAMEHTLISPAMIDEIQATIEDYVANHYGDGEELDGD